MRLYHRAKTLFFDIRSRQKSEVLMPLVRVITRRPVARRSRRNVPRHSCRIKKTPYRGIHAELKNTMPQPKKTATTILTSKSLAP
jgi:hypothetical protein